MARQEDDFYRLDKTHLLRLKTKAMRAGVWFKALLRIDRVLVDLTIKVASYVRSVTLAQRILTVTRKLEKLLVSKLSFAIREIGFPIARKLSLLAQKWGNTSAKEWSKDAAFARYLVITQLSTYKPEAK